MNILVAMETKPYQRVWLEEAAPGEIYFTSGGTESDNIATVSYTHLTLPTKA